ncbi:helix-turn-helix domain-containing protein [Komagataeibacter melomenusus]
MTAAPAHVMEKRVDAHAIAERTGVPRRTILALAQRGEIPAAKIGRRWTFSPARIEAWIIEQEALNCQSHRVDSRPKHRRTASYAAIHGGRRSPFEANDTEKAYAQLMRGKRKGG